MGAKKAKQMAEEILSEHKEKLMYVTPKLKPGRRFLSVNGGLTEGPVTIQEIKERKFKKLPIKSMKEPIIAATPTTGGKRKEVARTVPVTVRDQKEHRKRNQKEQSV